MFEDDVSMVLARSVVLFKEMRKYLKDKDIDIAMNASSFEACGGKRKKDENATYSVKRQLTLAERATRNLINQNTDWFGENSKKPAKKQILDHCEYARQFLDMLQAEREWDSSDNEDVDSLDGSYEEEDIDDGDEDENDDENEDEQEEEEEEEEEEGENDGDDKDYEENEEKKKDDDNEDDEDDEDENDEDEDDEDDAEDAD